MSNDKPYTATGFPKTNKSLVTNSKTPKSRPSNYQILWSKNFLRLPTKT